MPINLNSSKLSIKTEQKDTPFDELSPEPPEYRSGAGNKKKGLEGRWLNGWTYNWESGKNPPSKSADWVTKRCIVAKKQAKSTLCERIASTETQDHLSNIIKTAVQTSDLYSDPHVARSLMYAINTCDIKKVEEMLPAHLEKLKKDDRFSLKQPFWVHIDAIIAQLQKSQLEKPSPQNDDLIEQYKSLQLTLFMAH
jgi:hypothetical protein